jgi:hypothetical protein
LKSTTEATNALISVTDTAILQEINDQSNAISEELQKIDSTVKTLGAQLVKIESESTSQLARISNDISDAETSFSVEKSLNADTANEERIKLKVVHDSQEETYQSVIKKSEAEAAKLKADFDVHNAQYKQQKHGIAEIVDVEKDEHNETSTVILLANKIKVHTSNLVEQINIRNKTNNELEYLESQTIELSQKSAAENEVIMSIKNELVNRNLITDKTEITE